MHKIRGMFVEFFKFCSRNVADLVVLAGLSLIITAIYKFNAIIGQITLGLAIFLIGMLISRK